MEKILEVFDGFAGEIARAKMEISKAISCYDKKNAELDANISIIGEKEIELKERENEIAKIESVVALEAEAKKTLKESKELISGFSKEKDTFTDSVIQQTKDINAARAELENKNKLLKREWAILKDAQKVLNEDKENYKIKMAKGIVDLASKK